MSSSDPVRPPAPNPCGSCPYRLDVPSGVWSPEEYEKLPVFDDPQNPSAWGLFLCHQQDGRLCAGWTACHDMDENIGLRLAVMSGTMSPEDADAARDYSTPVPIFESGAEAAAHGMREIETPSIGARRVVDRLVQKGVAQRGQ